VHGAAGWQRARAGTRAPLPPPPPPPPPPVLLPILACPLHTDACLPAILPGRSPPPSRPQVLLDAKPKPEPKPNPNQVLLDTQGFNRTEDEKQLAGASLHLYAHGHLHDPMLMSTKLSRVDRAAVELDDALYPAEGGGAAQAGYSDPYSHGGRSFQGHGEARRTRHADAVPFWEHDKFDRASRSRSRSRSRSSSRSRGRSGGRRRSPSRSRSRGRHRRREREADDTKRANTLLQELRPGTAPRRNGRSSPTYHDLCPPDE